MDRKKQQAEWLERHTLTPEQFMKLIQAKIERAKVQHERTVKSST